MNKKIVFLTGTRADFGKLKSLILKVSKSCDFDYSIFVTGMHMLYKYGLTVDEIHKTGFNNIFTFMNQIYGEPMEMVLANTISGLSRYVHESPPDMILVHGDRVEALAGAIVGALRNILVGHVEGGEISGTVDEIIRHSVTKLSHIHFVANEEAKHRLCQLGENPKSIYIIGSPDIDIMVSDELPDIEDTKKYYDINFTDYAVVIYHPVTTELQHQRKYADELVTALIDSKRNYIVVYPNNDAGSDQIFEAYTRLEKYSNIKIFPSIRFEFFLTLLKNAKFVIGNSSAGIREAPVFAVPTVNIGTRQHDRFFHKSIINAEPTKDEILKAIEQSMALSNLSPCHYFGNGKSVDNFMAAISNHRLWKTPKQKQFYDLPNIDNPI